MTKEKNTKSIKINKWKNQGAEILYFTSRIKSEEIEDDCESIGGREEMVITKISPAFTRFNNKIKKYT